MPDLITTQAAIRTKLDHARRQVQAAQRGIQVAEGRLLDFEFSDDILMMLHEAEVDLMELRGACFMCGGRIAADDSCACTAGRGVR